MLLFNSKIKSICNTALIMLALFVLLNQQPTDSAEAALIKREQMTEDLLSHDRLIEPRVRKHQLDDDDKDDEQAEAMEDEGSVANQAGPPEPMTAAASHHHHQNNIKGWLDMGAWAKKKGAFGWYADFPAGNR